MSVQEGWLVLLPFEVVEIRDGHMRLTMTIPAGGSIVFSVPETFFVENCVQNYDQCIVLEPPEPEPAKFKLVLGDQEVEVIPGSGVSGTMGPDGEGKLRNRVIYDLHEED